MVKYTNYTIFVYKFRRIGKTNSQIMANKGNLNFARKLFSYFQFAIGGGAGPGGEELWRKLVQKNIMKPEKEKPVYKVRTGHNLLIFS